MKKPNITPGEWEHRGHRAFRKGSYEIAWIAQQGPMQEWEANGRAIAAVPDLLDALEKLLVCPDLQFDAMEPESLEAMAAARAALTKAGYTF